MKKPIKKHDDIFGSPTKYWNGDLRESPKARDALPNLEDEMIQIPVAQLEFMDGGTTLWIHNGEGSTVLRIKANKVTVKRGCENICAHADITVNGEIEICIPEEFK